MCAREVAVDRVNIAESRRCMAVGNGVAGENNRTETNNQKLIIIVVVAFYRSSLI